MGNKIFVSYKYADANVRSLESYAGLLPVRTTVRNYVDKLEEKIGKDDIYKGEHDGEDMSQFADETIWTKLKERIFDSSITIVLISPAMKELWKLDKDQWIPQEISYSLKEHSRDGRTSHTNGLIAVVLPDKFGSYNYYIDELGFLFGNKYKDNISFDIIKNNRNNKKYGEGDYVVTVKWDTFIGNYKYYIDMAAQHRDNVEDYEITKII